MKRTFYRLTAIAVLLLCVCGFFMPVPHSVPTGIERGYGKLFGWNKATAVSTGESVYIGGFPLGLEIKAEGVIVEEIGSVETDAGSVAAQTDLQKDDIIVAVEGKTVATFDDLYAAVDDSDGKLLHLSARRGSGTAACTVQPILESASGRYRLGIFVKEGVSGIGTATFVRKDKRFVALGHPISVGKHTLKAVGGSVYPCEIVGIEKGRRGSPGEMKGLLKSTVIGKVESNTEYGVYGSLDSLPDTAIYPLGVRESVTCGKAQIYTTVDGEASFYDIEIIRALTQNRRADKSMVIRVTDKRLKARAGGIVQGMSGSPIIQNGAIVGAVTHVFVNDPLKGYGIYADWLSEEHVQS